jgi:catechol 2,3-dioxygenase-like lactoylglutathione lyase family enzyme
MQGFGLAFEHFGLATRDADKTLAFLAGLGYRTPESVHDPLQRVNLVLCEHAAMPAVEVIFAADEEGPLDAILAQQPQGIYHLCFRSRDLAASLAAIKMAGTRTKVVSPPKPAVLFDYLPVSFHMVRGFGLIEIIEDPS